MKAEPYYLETTQKLEIRIRAHTLYANFKLEEWLEDWIKGSAGRSLLELGCGDGNYFHIYASALGPEGEIIGMDLNPELLGQARGKANALETPTTLVAWDFDAHPYPMRNEQVDLLLALFSAYYSKNVPGWVQDALRVMKAHGRMLLIGPTSDNAKELYELNESLTGIRTVPETDETTSKLEREFLPELHACKNVEVDKSILRRELLFPSPEEFARYYLSTWLYEKTRERLGRAITFDDVTEVASRTSLRLSKELVCIEARKTYT